MCLPERQWLRYCQIQLCSVNIVFEIIPRNYISKLTFHICHEVFISYVQQQLEPSVEEVAPVASTSTAGHVASVAQQVRNCQN